MPVVDSLVAIMLSAAATGVTIIPPHLHLILHFPSNWEEK